LPRIKRSAKLYLIPTKLVPTKSEILYVVLNFKRAILIKHSQFTGTAWASSHQKYQGILGFVASGLKENIEHAAIKKHAENEWLKSYPTSSTDSVVI